MKFTTLIASFLLVPAGALDIIMQSITCDNALPIYATTFTVTCNGAARCTFGNTATIAGELVYNGTDATSIVDNTAYMSSDLAFLTLTYHLFDDLAVNLCHENMVAGADNRPCPGDGTYSFEMEYPLPSTADSSSWLATGWAGTGEIAMYAEKNNLETLVGYCTFSMATGVTASASQKFNPPSASTTSGILAGLIVAIFLAVAYCACCRGRRSTSSKRGQTDFEQDAQTHLTSKPEVRIN